MKTDCNNVCLKTIFLPASSSHSDSIGNDNGLRQFRLISEPNVTRVPLRRICQAGTTAPVMNVILYSQRQSEFRTVASFPLFLKLTHFILGLNRVHELTGLQHLARAIIAVIYCNNCQYCQEAKRQHFCHGHHGYSQAQVPVFTFINSRIPPK